MRIAILLLAMFASGSFCLAQTPRDRNASGFGGGFSQQGGDSRWFNPGNGNNWRPPSYQLGVQVRNTDRGVVLTNVVAGSPAQRAGLERNDTILSVSGYQVGYVGNQLYDVGDEINARADNNGRVLLLIQNGRDRNLRNLTVDLGFSRSVVSGMARWPNEPLSRDAMLVVRIIDVTNPAWTDTIVAEQNLRGVGRGGSQYEIGYSGANLQPGHRYAISAHVRDGDRVPYELIQPRTIDLNGSNVRLDFTLDRSRNPGGGFFPGGAFPTAQIVDLYRSLLGRPPTAREISIWQAEFANGATLNDVRRQLLSGSEFYDKNRNNDDNFIRDAYGSTLGRAPSPDEVARMKQQLQQSGGMRTDLVREILKRLDHP